MQKTKITEPADARSGEGARVISISPVVLPVPGRIVDLQMRITAPATGSDLPVILFAHGHGRLNNLSSLNGYAPLANYWAAQGFVVIQPTLLNSKSLNLDPNLPGSPYFWLSRAEDMRTILDHLEVIEASVPEINGRMDRSRIAVAGHSLGGVTASMLLGAQVGEKDGPKVDMTDSRIKAGVLLTPLGTGGANLAVTAADYSYFLNPSFAEMSTPALVVVGDNDVLSPLTTRGADWQTDAYFLSPAPKCLLTLFGAKHSLGGISGYDAAETTDENPERVALVQQLSTAYLRTALYPEDPSWEVASKVLMFSTNPMGRIESDYINQHFLDEIE